MANEQNLKPFKKGVDARRNTKGRPKSFDKLRALAQMIATEDGGVIDGRQLSNVEFALRKLMKDDTKLFLEIAYGKVPNPVELTGKDGGAIEVDDARETIQRKLAGISSTADEG